MPLAVLRRHTAPKTIDILHFFKMKFYRIGRQNWPKESNSVSQKFDQENLFLSPGRKT